MRCAVKLRKAVKLFACNEEGSIFIIFAIGLVFLVAVAGAGVDLGHQQLKTTRLQQAADAASTSGGGISVNMTPGGVRLSNEKITEVANRYFVLNYIPEPGETMPVPNITISGASPNTVLTVDSGTQTVATSFVKGFGTQTLDSKGRSGVDVLPAQLSDYDVVIVFDETGSTRNSDVRPTRLVAMKAAVTNMANSILPAGSTNPNVRVAFVGHSSHITSKWSLSSSNAEALSAINQFRSTCMNYDYVALKAAFSMLKGGVKTATNGLFQAPNSLNDNGNGCGVLENIDMPVPRTARTSTATTDSNGIANIKYVVFVSDGELMTNSLPCSDDMTDDRSRWSVNGNVNCYPLASGGNEAARDFKPFLAECQKLKDIGTHIYIVNFKDQAKSSLIPMQQCASPNLTTRTPDYYDAPDAAALNNVLNNITTQIRSVRITNVNVN